jgi:hypothetical protein
LEFDWIGHVFILLKPSMTVWTWTATSIDRKTHGVTFRSPDLTHLDFFHWGCVKDRVNTLAELKALITATPAGVTKGMLQRIRQEADCRWDVCKSYWWRLVWSVLHPVTSQLVCKKTVWVDNHTVQVPASSYFISCKSYRRYKSVSSFWNTL